MNNEAVYEDFPEKDSQNPENENFDSRPEGEVSETQEDSYGRFHGKDLVKENGSDASIFTAYNDDKHTGINGPALIASTPTSPASISISAVNAVGTTTSFATTVVEDAEQRKMLQISDTHEMTGQRKNDSLEKQEIPAENNEEIVIVTNESPDTYASVDEIFVLETLIRYYSYLSFILQSLFMLTTLSFFVGLYFILFVYTFLYTTVIPTILSKNPFLEDEDDRRVAQT